MKKTCICILAISLIIIYGGCSNVCQDPGSPNFNQQGSCLDYADNVTGTFIGTLRDSSGGGVIDSSVQVRLTKVNNKTVAVQLVSPSIALFRGFNATVTASVTGYYLTVNTDSTVTGAGAVFGSAADGIYVSSGRQLSIYAQTSANAGGIYESFSGTKQ